MAGSLKYVLARRLFKWRPVTGTVLDSRVKKRWRRNTDHARGGLPQDEYVVEIREDGQTAYSLKVEEPWGPLVNFHKARIGDTLPLLVNSDRTDAVVDLSHAHYQRSRDTKNRRQAAQQAWDKKWEGKTRN